MSKGFPWSEAMGFGLGVLGHAPDRFWSMTPRELAAAMRGRQGRLPLAAPGRAALDALMTRFPDG